jgi:SSS family solute:Na+ symporter
MGPQLLPSDYIVLAGYFALMLSIGLYFVRYIKRVEEYFTGANQLPWWLAGISHFMSSISAFVFVAYSEIAYKYGFVAVILWWMVIP